MLRTCQAPPRGLCCARRLLYLYQFIKGGLAQRVDRAGGNNYAQYYRYPYFDQDGGQR